MRVIRFADESGRVHFGRQQEDGAVTLLEGEWPDCMRDTGRKAEVGKLLAPVDPAAILCIGLNYREHAGETDWKEPDYPVLFMKNPAAVAHPNDPIVIPRSCMDPPQVDYEVELVAVIGKAAADVPAERALDHVLGYTIGNDVSAREWQMHGGGGQWIRGKSFDTFCPLGPSLVTRDEIPDPQALRLTCRLNGDVMQDGTTADMIFPVARLIEYLSSGTTLRPGTIIMTGTPSGVGFVRNPPVFLRPGDVVEMTIEPIGTLVNPVVAAGQGRGNR